MSPITLVTVTFAADARLSVLQALSLDRLFPLREVAEYIVVLNDSNPIALEAYLRRQLTGRIRQDLMDRIQFVCVTDVIETEGVQGQRSQQMIKLAIADRVSTEHYLLLDAKNMLTRPFSVADLWDGSRIKSRVSPVGRWDPYVRASLQALEVSTEGGVAETSLPTVTPYLMITAEVRELLAQLMKRFDNKLSLVFSSTHGKATEFFLYYAHLVKKYGDDLPYVHGEELCRSLFTVLPSGPGEAMDLILSAANYPVFGLHRNRLPQLTDPQRIAISALWHRYLLHDFESAEWFMTHDFDLYGA